MAACAGRRKHVLFSSHGKSGLERRKCLTAGLNDLTGSFQPRRAYDSMNWPDLFISDVWFSY